jgi:hypothetical protein
MINMKESEQGGLGVFEGIIPGVVQILDKCAGIITTSRL